MQHFNKLAEVKTLASGNWENILRALSPNLFGAGNPTKHRPCPVHGGSDGFRFMERFRETGGCVCNTCGLKKSGFDTLMWVNGWSFKQALEAVGEYVGVGSSHSELYDPTYLKQKKEEYQKKMEAEQKKHEAEAVKVIATILKGCSSIEGTLAEAYLSSRKIVLSKRVLESKALRFHSHLLAEGNSAYPAMVAEITDLNGKVVALHRTYLSQEGTKAPLDNPKKITKSLGMKGASIKLGSIPESGVLGIAEGIETALSVNQATGMSCWATVSSTIMKTFEPPKEVKRLIIWADYDQNGCGQTAAFELKQKLATTNPELTVLVVFPKNNGESCDWNDVLAGTSKSKGGFPNHHQICAAIFAAEAKKANSTI